LDVRSPASAPFLRHHGRSLLPLAKMICQSDLGWSESQWSAQEQRYLKLWREDHAPDLTA
jgi:hypothetical protein